MAALQRDVEELCESLVIWISGFEVDVPHARAHDLTDGIAMAEVLNQLDNDYFSKSWLGRLKKGVTDNHRLKTNNLKKVLNQIIDYFKEVCGNTIVGYEMPDVSMISERADSRQLGRLLQLMLGVAVNCPGKQRYIEEIMELDENVQHVVMTAIQELMQHYQPCSEERSAADEEEVAQQVKVLEGKLSDAISDKEEMAQRCHELDMQLSSVFAELINFKSEAAVLHDKVAMLHEEKANIQQENSQLLERLNQTENLEDPTSPASVRHSQMLNQIDALQEETYRLEASRDDFKLRCEIVERDLLDSQSKIEELSELAEESRLLKDEIDYLRSASDKAVKLEATLESYKIKLKELADLRGQVKLLEERNTSFMERTVEVEEELKKANAARSQLDGYKRQVIDLHKKLSDETRRADKGEFEIKTKTEKMKGMEAEIQRLSVERDALKETNEELQVSSHPGAQGFMSEQLLSSSEPGNPDALTLSPLELKEKVIRLQHENKMLKVQQGALGDEKLASLSGDLELANSRINELETDNRLSDRRVVELEAQVKELQEEMQVKGASSEDNQALRQRLQEHLTKLHATNEELQSKKAYIESVEPQLSHGNKQVIEMKELLKKKEADMKAMEDRYKKYLEKAKSVIRTLDPNKNQQTSAPQLHKLKSEIQEKDKMIKQMEKEQDRNKSVREQEEKLVVNAWYNMGMQLHRKAVDERLSHTTPGQSFLARQRQASSARRSLPGSVQSSH